MILITGILIFLPAYTVLSVPIIGPDIMILFSGVITVALAMIPFTGAEV
jgi:hypothetical protein